ncbi:hypothetical protein BCR33DRAFT_740144 [Rhizoclosmatium globosum]|uniref:Uncharacterized protein n=1 Tax=Rhizoclosmatium globosum TaxID=329046 RepID=A0A1Y2C364_9FUNG|nr:hypothetical protein BCR33DRAFT_740144 [Rhizoclosmatium globosum]|eukprot:ORY40755.1 hypothetical protein BCR33DRAFT_740144 [Rhizoclosmatium globosum]
MCFQTLIAIVRMTGRRKPAKQASPYEFDGGIQFPFRFEDVMEQNCLNLEGRALQGKLAAFPLKAPSQTKSATELLRSFWKNGRDKCQAITWNRFFVRTKRILKNYCLTKPASIVVDLITSSPDQTSNQNQRCQTKWLHYECVGLTSDDGLKLGASVEKWFCPQCSTKQPINYQPINTNANENLRRALLSPITPVPRSLGKSGTPFIISNLSIEAKVLVTVHVNCSDPFYDFGEWDIQLVPVQSSNGVLTFSVDNVPAALNAHSKFSSLYLSDKVAEFLYLLSWSW